MMDDPHGTHAIVTAGVPLASAEGAIVVLHGRGSSAETILGLGEAVVPEGWAILAPQAAGGTWYPYSFLAPREQNEPYLTSALERVETTCQIAYASGLPAKRVVVAGFSQGACLATEFVGRNPRAYGALIAFTGGLIGPPGATLSLSGDLAGMAALFTSGDPDPHVPWERVEESAALFESMGARVTLRRWPGRAHTITAEEIKIARDLLASL
jgi:phospholipase/carboxylesterase